MSDTENSKEALRFFVTQPQPCSYFTPRESTSLVLDPDIKLSTTLYEELIQYGFRRSGNTLYRPHCATCQDCIASRVRTTDFCPSRNQRRNIKLNQDIRIQLREPCFSDEHFALYCRYLDGQHPEGGMNNPTPESYLKFLTSEGIDTLFIEGRVNNQLILVAVIDCLQQGWSAVYTFYEPQQRHRGLGKYAILWQLEQLKQKQLPWHYLGYWLENHHKMSYKNQYQPFEIYQNEQWTMARS
ncbi:MAG: arginyltransferase [Gammaproteobacteria bacterium]|nr:arginyltransferase [Gammaproteobacteria bacterium]